MRGFGERQDNRLPTLPGIPDSRTITGLDKILVLITVGKVRTVSRFGTT